MMPRPTHNKAGSALLLTLLVVSLMMVVVLSYTAFVRIKLRAVQARIELQRAKSNAWVAMHLALNELQIAAGPDQRATARAEILGTSRAENELWTGVWDSRTNTGSPTWLVSKQSGSPDPSSDDFSKLMVGSETVGSNRNLFLYADPIETGEHQYAWIVMDSGVKANIAQFRDPETPDIPGYDADEIDTQIRERNNWRLNQLYLQNSTVADLSTELRKFAASKGLSDDDWRFTHKQSATASYDLTVEFLEKLNIWENFDFSDTLIQGSVNPDTAQDVAREFTETHYHDFTANSKFVLSNTLDGGLRQDLSHLRRMTSSTQAALDSAFAAPSWNFITPSLWEFVNFDKLTGFNNFASQLPDDGNGFIVEPTLSTDYETSPVGFTTAPWATEIAWNAGLGIRSKTGGVITQDIYLYFYSIVEMLNPTGYVLNLDNGTGATPGSPSDLQIRISNFPSITITNNDPTRGASTTLDLSELVIAIDSNSYRSHAPGYMRTNFNPTSGFRMNIDGGDMGRGVYTMKIGEFPSVPDTRDDFDVEFGVSDLVIEIYESNANPRVTTDTEAREAWGYFLTDDTKPALVPVFPTSEDPSAGPVLLKRITLENWGNFTIDYGTDDASRFVHGGTNMNRNRLGGDVVNFGVHLKVVDDWVDARATEQQPLDDYLSLFNFRAHELFIDMTNPNNGDGAFLEARPPLDVSRTAFSNSTDIFHGAYWGSISSNRRAYMADFPTQEPTSVGALNQLTFRGFPNQPLGNRPYGRGAPIISDDGLDPNESLNNFFDRYFFSTIPENPNDWDGQSPLPNSNLELAEANAFSSSRLSSPNSATELMVKHGFNVNSLSAEAWLALLQHSDIESFTAVETIINGGGSPSGTSRVEKALEGIIYAQHPFSGNLHVAGSGAQAFDFVNSAQPFAGLTEGLNSTPAHVAMLQGVRDIPVEDLELLAENIVTQVEAYTSSQGRPFRSLTDLLNSGVLQNAIDSVSSLNTSSNGKIPTLSAAYFGVGSILNHLADAMFVRSDTFVIRSTGAVKDSTNTVRSEAFLEATVQRFPDEMGSFFGRRFEILEVKWVEVRP